MTDTRPCRVVLVGMMGSGKTTIGRALAEHTGWGYHDNDELLAAATGRSAAEIALSGEAALRSAEAAALAEALSMPPPTIVAVAAGSVLDRDHRERLRRDALVVWLHAAPERLASRATGAAHRPWLDDDAAQWFARAAAEREPLYRAVADLVVETGASGPAAAAERILDWLRGTACARWVPPAREAQP
ncbi:MAG TPA: shikimate kinase [Candidatus Limnocylindria bacterium]|nr:shikimate kinase [Candidatus Limnocylindria bacterium]